MIRLLTLLIILLSFVGAGFSQSANDDVRLRRMLNEFLDGASKNDPAVHERFWADDLIYTRSAGVRINKAELMQGVRGVPAPKPDDPVTIYTAKDVQIHQYGDTAVVAFVLVATTKKGSSSGISLYLNTGTFVKRRGAWRVAAWQSTGVPKTKT